MKFPKLLGTKSTEKYVIYFSCDQNYYLEHGIPLIKSIVETIDWIGVHVHLVLYRPPTSLFFNKKVSYSYEIIDENFINSIKLDHAGIKMTNNENILRTTDPYRIKELIYFSCARFLKLPELFESTQYVMQIDADAILYNKFNKLEFIKVTETPRGMRKPKDPSTIIASCVGLGVGSAGMNFREEFSSRLKEEFKKGAYWFIDQHVLKKVFEKIEFETIDTKWCNWGIKKNDYFSTGKGEKKSHPRYLERVSKWKDT
jgi:hypothetical protein